MPALATCLSCHHRRSFHEKVDGNSYCKVQFCACKEFKESKIITLRQAAHDALEDIINAIEEGGTIE